MTALALLLLLAASPDPAEPRRNLVVVELFTSQGCGLCPDANRLLSELGEREDTLALAFNVSYWDMYGWTDQFARPEFNQRQQDYVDAGPAHRVYTPHFVVNGAPQVLRFDRGQILGAVRGAEPVALHPSPLRTADGLQVRLNGPAREQAATVWLAAYETGTIERTIEAGSNAGLDMVHFNTVRQLTALPGWSGAEYSVTAEPAACPDSLSCAVLVQASRGGPILGASRIPAVNREPAYQAGG